jgi:hypothetical protein
MIKKLLSISLITAALAANAQQITNAGFETWSGSPLTPNSWGTLDKAIATSSLSGLIGPTSFVSQSTSPNSGTYAANLTTKTTNFGTFPGVLVYGNMVLGGSSGTTPMITGQSYTNTPVSVSYYVKGTVLAGDSAPTIIMLTHWNTSTNKRDTIAEGADFLNSNAVMSSMYMLRTFNLSYKISGVSPDTMQYIISSSVNTSSPTVGTSITVDDISFSGNYTGISSVHQAQNASLAYPNPAVNQITLTSSNEKAKFATVYDLTGRMVGKYELLNKAVAVDLNAFQNGIYIYAITDDSNHTITTSKFSVSK